MLSEMIAVFRDAAPTMTRTEDNEAAAAHGGADVAASRTLSLDEVMQESA